MRKSDELSRMAGLLTIKPVITAPIWFGIMAAFEPSYDRLGPSHFLSILPGASLTLITAVAFRRLFSGPRARVAWVLLALDCARWLNSFFIYWPYGDGSLNCLSALCGLSMPTVFATIALTTALGAED